MSRGRLSILQEALISELIANWGGFPPMARFWALLDVIDNDELYQVVYEIIADQDAREGTIAAVFHDLQGVAEQDEHFVPKLKPIAAAAGL